MSHTPGPWKRCGGATPHYMAICDSSYRYIVFSMADRLVDTEHGKPIDAPGMDEQFANARLISAAPDLLAACKAFDIALCIGNRDELIAAAVLARAAISKAEQA